MILINSNLRGLQAGLVSIVETNVEWQKFEWMESTYQTLRKTFANARAEFEGRYQPRGISTTALGAWTVVVTGSDTTGCGRWSYITNGGKDGKRLTYVTV
jgi:hypothetical protein